MRCPSCGSHGSEGARFCERCGTQLPQADVGLPPEVHGSSAPRDRGPGTGPPAGGDRRIVTALFADLVDYVRMLAEHDPEEVRDRGTAAPAAMADAIERLDGTGGEVIGGPGVGGFGW